MEMLPRADGCYDQSPVFVADLLIGLCLIATGDDRDDKNAKGSMVNIAVSKFDFMRGISCYTLGTAAVKASEASSSRLPSNVGPGVKIQERA